MHREDQEIEKINERRVALVNAVSEIEGRRRAAEQRLASLQSGLGEIVLRAAMGEVPADEPRKIRREMQELREAIEDAELVLEPARRREVRLNGDETKWSRLRPLRQEYDALKAKITEAGAATESEAHKLRDLCAMLDGSTSATDAAIATAKQAKAAA